MGAEGGISMQMGDAPCTLPSFIPDEGNGRYAFLRSFSPQAARLGLQLSQRPEGPAKRTD